MKEKLENEDIEHIYIPEITPKLPKVYKDYHGAMMVGHTWFSSKGCLGSTSLRKQQEPAACQLSR
eukprot:4165532-Amphidinium_carterae.1